jgi:hypothetical protein
LVSQLGTLTWPELFFKIGNTGTALLQIEEAKAVCRRCEVVEPCLSWAMESRQEDGSGIVRVFPFPSAWRSCRREW